MTYAGFWKRVAAALIDSLITTAIGMMAGFILGRPHGAEAELEPLAVVVSLLVGWIYFASFESSNKQATPGKMALGIKVTDLDGTRIGFGKASGRHFSKFVSALIIFIGFVMVAFTKRRQGLHDIMAGCLVINKEARQSDMSY